MSKFTISLSFETSEELLAAIAKLEGTAVAAKTKPAVDEDDDEKPTGKPAKPAGKAKAKPADDEDEDDDEDEKPAGKGKAKAKPADDEDDEDDADAVEAKRVELRKALRKLSALTDRKSAVKVLSKFGTAVDTVEVAKIPAALKAVNAAIETAEAE